LEAPVEMVASGGPTLSAVADDSGPESEDSGGGMEGRAGIVSSEEDEPDAQVAPARAERSRLVASAKAESVALGQVDEKRAPWVAERGGASMEFIEVLEWGFATGLAIAGQLGSLRAAVTLAGSAGASHETQHEIMDPFASDTVGDRPGQLRRASVRGLPRSTVSVSSGA